LFVLSLLKLAFIFLDKTAIFPCETSGKISVEELAWISGLWVTEWYTCTGCSAVWTLYGCCCLIWRFLAKGM